jgi:hypothetical protein
MDWTSPSRDKRYGLNKALQRQDIHVWAVQFPTVARHMPWIIPGRQTTFGADNSRQGQEILGGQFLAETRHTGLIIPGRDRRFWMDNSRQGQDILG